MEFEALGALQGALGPLGGQIGPPEGAHMQVKWPSGPSDFVFFPPKAKFDRPRRAQKPLNYRRNIRVGRIQGLEGPFWASRLHMSSVFEEGRK